MRVLPNPEEWEMKIVSRHVLLRNVVNSDAGSTEVDFSHASQNMIEQKDAAVIRHGAALRYLERSVPPVSCATG